MKAVIVGLRCKIHIALLTYFKLPSELQNKRNIYTYTHIYIYLDSEKGRDEPMYSGALLAAACG